MKRKARRQRRWTMRNAPAYEFGSPTSNIEIGAEGRAARTWDDLVLIGDGRTDFANGNHVIIDAEAGARIVAAFEKQGVDLPIDVEHSTLNTPEDAPAQGFVSHLRYVPGRGILGRVEWNDVGIDKVVSRSYKYLSPVAIYDKATRKVNRLHSVALTNKPAIRHAKALIAASERLAGSELIAMAEHPPNGEAEGMEQTGPNPAVLVGEIKAALKAKGIEIADDADEISVLMAVRDFLAGESGDAEGEGEGEDGEGGEAAEAASTLAEIKKLLGADANDDAVNKVLAALGDKGAREEVAKLTERLKVLEGEATTVTATAAVDAATSEGKIVASQRDVMLKMAKRDMAAFNEYVEASPVIVEQGATVPIGGANPGNREGVIAASVRESNASGWNNNTKQTTNWVNMELKDKKLSPLTDDEKAKHNLVAV